MSFDNCCKLLAEKYPQEFASWLLGQPIQNVEILKTELSIEPIRADSVILLKTQTQILHIEFQVLLDSEPPLPLRFLDYWVRLYRLHRIPITQILVLLRPPAKGTIIETAFRFGKTYHEYSVVKLWEQDPALFLNNPALLPLAPLTATQNPETLLSQTAIEVSKIESETRRKEVSAYVQLMAGLRFKKNLIYQIFQESIMRESVIYQDILQKGEQEGRQKGRQEGRQEEALNFLLRLINHRFSSISPETEAQIRSLPLTQIETLGEAFLDFTQPAELDIWLRSQS
jgi:predicted transposase/invertase (TIGR01784 family)